MQFCWDYRMLKEARDLALKALGQLSIFLMNLKLESSIKPNTKHENLAQECIRMVCILGGIWLPLLDLQRHNIDQIEDAFQTVRELTRWNASAEDNFRNSLLAPLSQLASKVAHLREEKRSIEDIILMPYQYQAAELQYEMEKNQKNSKLDPSGASEIVEVLKSYGHFLKERREIQEEKERIKEASKEKLNELTEKELTTAEFNLKKVVMEPEEVPKKPNEQEKSDFKFYLESFVKLGKRNTTSKKSKKKEMRDEIEIVPNAASEKKQSKCGKVLDMDGYFDICINRKLKNKAIPDNLQLPVYNKTYTNEKWYWISNLRGKNININSNVMMHKVNSLDTIVRSDYDHMNMTIKVGFS